jgi:hypothetical protein
VSALAPEPVEVSGALVAGEASTALPAVDAWWVPVIVETDTAADQTSLDVTLTVSGPVDGLLVDGLSLTAFPLVEGEETPNLLANPSFESITPAVAGIVNDSLILDSRTATMAVALPADTAGTWHVRANGQDVASGEIAAGEPVVAVPLDGVQAGSWEFAVDGQFGEAASVTAPFAVVDGAIVPDERLGVHVHATDYTEGGPAAAASLGFGYMRVTVPWRTLEKTAGQYERANGFAARIDAAHALGLKVLAIAPSRNPLYDDNRTPSSPGALAALGAVTAHVVSEYGVDAVEAYNEFNHEPFNNGACGLGADCYIQMLAAVSDAVRAVNPDIPIVAGSTAEFDGPWFDELWSAGGLNYANDMSFHPYSIYFAPEQVAGLIDQANAGAAQYGTPPGIWISEMGWTTEEGGFNPQLQAEMLIRGEVTGITSGAQKVFWYDLVNDDPAGLTHEGAFGLFAQRVPGVAALPPKPAAIAQAVLSAEIGGLEFTGTEDLGPGVIVKVFGEGDSAVRVVWAPGGSATVAFPAGGPVRVVSASGVVGGLQPEGGSVSLPVTSSPVFVSGIG